jgi:murein lipoprotein
MKIVKISAVILAAGLATGCASTSDIDNLQAQIDGLSTQISTASSDAAQAKSSAAAAATAASEAKIAADRAAQYAQDTNSKLDRMFKKSMMK